mgnify:FL=1
MAKRKNKIVWGASALVRGQDHRAPSGGMPVAATGGAAEADRRRSSREVGSPRSSRNWLAVRAHLRSGAGTHIDRKKQKSKRACRGRVKGGE